MLTIRGGKYRLCDKLTRRDVLRIGALGMGGVTLSQLLKLEAMAGVRHSQKSIIMIYMVGAPSHQDMYDLKMDAPAEIRGEFQPVATPVPGLQITTRTFATPAARRLMSRRVDGRRSARRSPSYRGQQFPVCRPSSV